MISRVVAVERAAAYLRDRGSSGLPYPDGAQPNPSQGLWIVEQRDPQHHPDDQTTGGSVLVVPNDLPVYEISYHPDAAELVGIQTPAEVAGLPAAWATVLDDYLEPSYWWDLITQISIERADHLVYPETETVFAAFQETTYEDVRVVILGQDPDPNPGQANGLCFSVPRGVPKPPSLRRSINFCAPTCRSRRPTTGT